MKTIVVLLCGALALAACGRSPYKLTAPEQETAELGARDWADRSQSDYVGCSGQDSDRDGYVTCTIKARVSVGGAPPVESDLLCSFAEGSRGCKRK